MVKEFTYVNEDKEIKVHRIGLCTGMAAIMFWASGMCFGLSVAGITLKYWTNHYELFDFSDKGMWLTMLESYPL